MFGAKIDSGVLIFSGLAVLVAATLTMATIVNYNNASIPDDMMLSTPDPLKRAEQAAQAAIETAKFHIECHGRIEAGRLSPRFYVNGATYSAEWDDVDMSDSTTTVRSSASFSWGGEKDYQVNLESKIKLDFLPKHSMKILDKYYSKDKIVMETSGR